MIQSFFIILILITGISISVYSYFFNRKNLIMILALSVFSIFCLHYWYASILILFLFTMYEKYDFGQFISINMFSAIILAWFFLNLFIIGVPFPFQIGLVSLIILCLLAIFGIFEKELKKYLLISNIIQILFVILDLSITKSLGEFGILSTIQIFNYTFAGLTLFLTVGIFGRGKKYVYDLEGSYYTSRWNDIFATVSCLSLAGLPAFNIFVSEWMLFTHSFLVTPLITIFGIFAALLLFVMYYKIVYFLLIGEGRHKGIPKPVTITNGILAFMCVLLGLIPQLQIEILTRVIL